MSHYPVDDRPTQLARPLTLTLLNGPEAGKVLAVPTLPILIGRGGRSGLILFDPDEPPTLSREHATLRRDGVDLILTDHSTNGTFVGPHRLAPRETARIAPSDILQFGLTLRVAWQEGVSVEARPESSNGRADVGGNSRAARASDAIMAHVAAKSPPPCRRFREFLTAPETLEAAWKRVALNRGAAGPDNVTIPEFSHDARRRLDRLRNLLHKGQYEPLPPRLFAAPKRSGGVRTISILSIQDRIVQQALHAALSPHLEPEFPDCSYAYRTGRGAQAALRQVDLLLRQGLTWIAETDIAAFFDTISHRIMLEKLGARFPDPFLLSLVSRCLSVCATAPGRGVPQGAATSPLFGNLYLLKFDRKMEAERWNPVRYGDDMVFACASKGRAQRAIAEAEGFLRGHLQLALKPEKTAVRPLEEGFTFLGFRYSATGREAAPEAVAQLAQRLEEAAPDQAAAVRRGWQNYFGAPPISVQTTPNRAEAEAAAAPSSRNHNIVSVPATAQGEAESRPQETSHGHWEGNAMFDEETWERMRTLFMGREGLFARLTAERGGIHRTPCAGNLTVAEVESHLRGEQSLALYPLQTDGRLAFLVLDLDASRGNRRPTGAAPLSEAEREPAVALSRDLWRLCRSLGIPAVQEESGRKGRHLWLFFTQPIPAETGRRLARLLLARAGYPRDGVRAEIFPRQTEWTGAELGDTIKLPFGVHPVSGQRCYLLDAHDEPIIDPATAIERIRTLAPDEVEAVLKTLTHLVTADTAGPAPTEPGAALGQLLRNCAVVRALVQKARQTGHLRHTQQLILLYTAGHLGQEGADFLHRTIALCRNYDANICQRYIDRLDPTHPPLGCRRIREWLEEEGETGLCTCSATRRTPLEGIVQPSTPKSRKAFAPPASPASAADRWHDVAAELFDSDDSMPER